MMMSDIWLHRIKAAQRDLIKLCGGIDRSVELTSHASSTVGRWNNPRDPDLMSLGAVLILEADCGVPLVTAAMAALNGRRLAEPDEGGAAGAGVVASHSDVMIRIAEVMTSGAVALSDGKVSPAEAMTMDRDCAALEQAVAKHRLSLAGAKTGAGAKGGGQ